MILGSLLAYLAREAFPAKFVNHFDYHGKLDFLLSPEERCDIYKRHTADKFGTPEYGDPEYAEEAHRYNTFMNWFNSCERTEEERYHYGIYYPKTAKEPLGKLIRYRVQDRINYMPKERPWFERGHIAFIGLSDIHVRQMEKETSSEAASSEKREMWDGLF